MDRYHGRSHALRRSEVHHLDCAGGPGTAVPICCLAAGRARWEFVDRDATWLESLAAGAVAHIRCESRIDQRDVRGRERQRVDRTGWTRKPGCPSLSRGLHASALLYRRGRTRPAEEFVLCFFAPEGCAGERMDGWRHRGGALAGGQFHHL